MQARKPGNARGIDVSHYQGVIDWTQVRGAGYSFALCKATEGHTCVDDTFTANISGAKAAGMAVGAYHFFRARTLDEARHEAEYFCSVLDSIGGIDALDIPPILDVETTQNCTGEQITAMALAWLQEVEKRGVKPLIYTYPYFADAYLGEALAGYKLHFAFYADGVPGDHGPYKEWTFLQYTDRGTVPGINAPCDLNEFAGGVEDLMGYKISAEDANYIIERWLSKEFEHASDDDRDRRHKLANELRKASGQPTE